jgi:hypothetical protein
MITGRRIVLLLLFAGNCLVSVAQLPAPLRPLLLGDSTAPLRYDTAHVLSYKKSLSIGFVTSIQNSSISLSDSLNNRLEFSTNNPTQYGIGFSLGWLSAEITFTVPGWSVADTLRGATSSRNLGVGTTGSRLIGRALWNSSEGFHPEDPATIDSSWTAGDRYPARPDIRSNTFLVSANYALSGKGRFSFKAALYQTERQRRSAGTFLLGGALWLNDIRSDGPFLPALGNDRFLKGADFDQIRRTVLGATIGYIHTFVIGGKGFVTMALVPGLSAQQQRISLLAASEVASDWKVGALAELKFGIGFNGDRFYAALNSAQYLNIGEVVDGLNVGTGFRFGRFSVGYRMKPPPSKFMRSIGL